VRTLKLTLAYDGTNFAGWQVQANERTVQGVLEEVLLRITGEASRATASGRTDAGVHALGQVVSLGTGTHLSDKVLLRALNAELPDDVSVLSLQTVHDDFHAIRDSWRKRYQYRLIDGTIRDVFLRRYAWHVFQNLDDQAMQQAAKPLVGRHDFSSFESSGAERASSVRTVTALNVARNDHLLTVDIQADGFLYNMVRAIVGTLVEVGRGAQPISWPAEVLEAKERSQAGPTAPPQGLFLCQVDYDD